MLAVSQDICQFCITASITARFGKANLDIVIAVLIGLGRGQTQSRFQFTCGAGFVFCAGTHHSGKVALYLLQDNFTACLQYAFSNGIKVLSQTGHPFQKFIRHFDINLCQQSPPPFWQEPPCTYRVL